MKYLTNVFEMFYIFVVSSIVFCGVTWLIGNMMNKMDESFFPQWFVGVLLYGLTVEVLIGILR